MKRFIFNFFDKMEYFFTNLYEKSLDNLLKTDCEDNLLIIILKNFYLDLIQIFAFISFFIVLFLFLPIVFILDFVDIHKRIFQTLLRR